MIGLACGNDIGKTVAGIYHPIAAFPKRTEIGLLKPVLQRFSPGTQIPGLDAISTKTGSGGKDLNVMGIETTQNGLDVEIETVTDDDKPEATPLAIRK
jgi:hypothetical protein